MTVHLTELLSRAATEAPDRTALVEAFSGRRVTWAELDDETDRVAAGLDAMGLVAGYRVVIALTNRWSSSRRTSGPCAPVWSRSP